MERFSVPSPAVSPAACETASRHRAAHPYRTAPDEDALPSIPMRSLLPMGILGGVLLIALASAAIVLRPSAAPAPTALSTSIPTLDVGSLIASFQDVDAAARLRDRTVTIRGVLRERRNDSFGNGYVELGTGLGYEVPIVQCFIADADATTPAPGTVARFRARLIGMSLGVALQADECVALDAVGAPPQ